MEPKKSGIVMPLCWSMDSSALLLLVVVVVLLLVVVVDEAVSALLVHVFGFTFETISSSVVVTS